MTTKEATWRQGLGRWWPFVLLCLGSVLRWNLLETFPQAASTARSESAGCFIAASVCCVWALLGRSPRASRKLAGRNLLAGALLLCGPELALLTPNVAVRGTDILIALALTPLVVAIGTRAFDTSRGGDVPFWPGIAATSALLLLLPQPWPRSAVAYIVLALCPILTGIGCVLFYTEGDDAGAWSAGMAVLGAAMLFGAAGTGKNQPSVEILAVALDTVFALLAVLALCRLQASRYAALFVLGPMLVLVEGWVLLRPALDLRSSGGLALLAVSAIYLLRTPPAAEHEEPFSLRG